VSHLADPLLLDALERRLGRDRANFRLALALALAFVALVVGLQFLAALGDGPVELGVRPRTAIGLLGILFAPLLHADFAHVFSNAVPLVVIGTALLYLYPQSARAVLPAVYFGPGAAVWLVGRDSMHLGASGLVYGMFAYVLAAGLLRRDRRALAAALMVVLLYGTLVWGVLPIQPRMSWETHLAAAVIGVALAFALRGRDVREPTRYDWEREDSRDEDPSTFDDWGWRTTPVAPTASVGVAPATDAPTQRDAPLATGTASPDDTRAR
jgi:membrane associated rhomboid family serine protease